MKKDHEKLVILGTGPAGLTAAIYAARANLEPLCIEGMQPGGQLTITSEVENYPGYPKGVMGPQMMVDLKEQAARFGTRYHQGEVRKVDLAKRPFTLEFSEGSKTVCDVLIIATGASAIWLNIPSEKRLMGKGVSACATCDGFFFKNQDVAVVGGGDSAMEEANFLTKFARSVTVIHRRDTLRASKIMQQRALNHPKIKFEWNSAVDEVLGDKEVTGVRLKNVATGALKELPVHGLFLAIGHEPNTKIFKEQIKCDERGYIIVEPFSTKTNILGVFAAGDVSDHKYRQAVTAAGMGCMAAIDAEKFLESLPGGH